jgi:hypothetical protein
VRARLKKPLVRVARKQVAPVRADVAKLRTEWNHERQRSIESAIAIEEIRATLQRDKGWEAAVAGLAANVETIRSRVDERDQAERLADLQRRELDAVLANYRGTFDALFGPTGRHVTRFVLEDEITQLVEEFSFVDDRDAVVVAVHQAYRLLIELELRGLGRFAGSTPNVVAKLAALAVLPLPSDEVLEIGTLFGLGAVGVVRQLARREMAASITIVDPFAGHQVQPDRGDENDVSHTPATRSVVEANLALGGVSRKRYRLVEGLSGDDSVRSAISDRRYGLIVIDGNHSEEAALDDLLIAEQLAADDGLVLLDDYRDPAWPGVEKALDHYLRRDGARLSVVGTVATTAVLRAGRQQ